MTRARFVAIALACVAWACASPATPAAEPSAPAVFVETDAEAESRCAEPMGTPQAVLDGRLSLRLPAGVAESLRESPERLEAGPVALPCVGGRTLVRLSLTMRPDNPDYLMMDFRDDALVALDYAYGMKIETLVEDEGARELVSIISVPIDETATEIGKRVYMRVFRVEQTIYVLALEAALVDFDALRPTFEAVAASAVGGS